eukprot:TRINITY_DN35839_c0_g1_i1.p1 TRINITY_DN35839_c0_g1~~TRINITY_DN35839_c0_g1_i1.p1  ORF type:complete len:420 (+),score=132.76 TRINITY_DN35839_c0_g1_i1:190-1260(+)
MAALHARETASLVERHEEEKLELSRQRDECRQYWYKNKEMNEQQHKSLVHRAERFAVTVAMRGTHSVWKQSPQLLQKALESPLYRLNLQRTVWGAWKQHTKSQRNKAHVEGFVNKASVHRMKKEVFAAWRVVSLSEASRRRHERFQQQVRTEWDTMQNDHDTEVAGLRDQIAKLQRLLETETQHRGALEERLKVAFMRGVCALNLEAMQVMRTEDGAAAAAAPPQGMMSSNQPTTMSATPIQPLSEDTPTATHFDPILSLSSVPQPPLNRAPVVEAVPRGANSAILGRLDRSASSSPPAPPQPRVITRPSTPSRGGSSVQPSPRSRPPLAGQSVPSALAKNMQASISAKEIQARRF